MAGWQLLESRTGSAATEQYIWGVRYVDDLMLRDRDANAFSTDGLEERLYAIQDAHFNVTAVVDDSGDEVERYRYSPYGQRTVLTPAFALDADGFSDVDFQFGHQGMMHDAETGLVCSRARMRHAELGRWLQREPLGYVDGMSLYQYVRGVPTFYVDPSGRESQLPEMHGPCYGGVGCQVDDRLRPGGRGSGVRDNRTGGIGSRQSLRDQIGSPGRTPRDLMPGTSNLVGAGVESVVTKPYDDYVNEGERLAREHGTRTFLCNALRMADEAGMLSSGTSGIYSAKGKDYDWNAYRHNGKCYFNASFEEWEHFWTLMGWGDSGWRHLRKQAIGPGECETTNVRRPCDGCRRR